MKSLLRRQWTVMIVTWLSFGLVAATGWPTHAANVNLQAGTLPQHWIDGTGCNSEPPIQVHAYNKDLFILRQSLCTNFEAPFVYLIFGKDRVLMLDTGAGSIPIRAVVDNIIATWLKERGRPDIELIVSHSHSHGDHVAGDGQFTHRSNTRIVGYTPAAIQTFFAINNWPADSAEFDLGGGRIVNVIPLPGHEDAHIALYDRQTGLLLTGDSLYPGRLYVPESAFPMYRDSIVRLLAFTADKEVRHILGAHIEMSAQPGVDFSPGSSQHQDEHHLELTRQHLVELNMALQAMGSKPKRETHDDFIVFPLRRSVAAALPVAAAPLAAPSSLRMDPSSPVIFKEIEGLGDRQVMGADEVHERLEDPFAQLVLSDPELPSGVPDVLRALDRHNTEPEGLPTQEVYLVSESGQILVAEDQDLQRGERAVITRTRGQDAIVMITPSTREPILEVIAWDADRNVFNYYAREGIRTWVWKGSSPDALKDPSRGQGCFKCHMNGAPIMKELLVPWTNWHSQSAPIQNESIPTDSPLKNDPLFMPQNLTDASQLEKHIQAWIAKTNSGHINRLQQGQVDVRTILRPLFETTTANLAFSTNPSASSSPNVLIPLSFFLNSRAFGDAAGVDVTVPQEFGQCSPTPFSCKPAVDRTFYQESLVKFDFALKSKGFERKPGDTHFAFAVPEPAFEDIDMIKQLVRNRLISSRFAACALAVDFPNPVYSPVRRQLLQFVPATPLADLGGRDIDNTVADVISSRASELPADHPDRRAIDPFLECWTLPEMTWRTTLSNRFEKYLRKVAAQLKTKEGFFKYVELSEARRMQFINSSHGALKESALLFPVSNALNNVSASPEKISMTADGTVWVDR
jgi:hydroxyacylglutathione hydrolase